jgi:hypothetical protein
MPKLVASTPPSAGPASLPTLSMPKSQLICRPRSPAAAPCEMTASRPISHICVAQPARKRSSMSWVNVSAKTISSDVSAAISGPAMITGRRPKRSISHPDGSVAATLPTRKAVTTPLATPKLTSKDCASAGMTGSTIPVPSARRNAGK